MSDVSDVLFSAVCKEDDERIERFARPMILTGDDVVRLWFKLNKFPILFASPQESNFGNFVRMLKDEYSILIEFPGIGLALVTDIVPGTEARFHISFWDSRLKGREPLVRELVRWIIKTLHVRRVSAPIRADARAMRAFMGRVGLYLEGILKNWIRKDTKYFDLHLFGIVEHEVDEHWLNGRSWAKPRVRSLEIYETR